MEMEDDTGQRPKFGFRIYENFRNIVKKSSRSSNYDLSEVSPTYEDVEVTGSHALSSLDSSMTNDSLNVVINKNDGNATDDSGIDSIEQNHSSPEPHNLQFLRFKNSDINHQTGGNSGNNFKKDHSSTTTTWKREFVLQKSVNNFEEPIAQAAELTSVRKKVEALETFDEKFREIDSSVPNNDNINIITDPAKAVNLPPIYSSVLKKKSNPARDFALTVLENDKKNVKTSKDHNSADLNEISQLLSSTNQLLSRNSHLRASLTISVKRSNSKKATTTTFIIPNPNKNNVEANNIAPTKSTPDVKKFEFVNIALDQADSDNRCCDTSDKSSDKGSDSSHSDEENLRKDSTSGDSGHGHSNSSCCDSSDKSSDKSSDSDKCDSHGNSSEEENTSESTLPSLEPVINPFTRYNPARRPISTPHHPTGTTMEVRRSIRLPPKTVASLASKFDNLLTPNQPKKNQEKEVQISKKGIASIIGTLEKLDEKAKHETFILQKNKLAKASTTQQDTNAQKKEDIDKLMKSTKSALEEVELPSSSTSPPQEQDMHCGPPLEILETTIDDNISEEGGSGGGAMPIGIDVSDSDIGTIGLANTCTDKYLRTLQKIAKQNAETGQFKTSLPKDQVLVIGQNISSTHAHCNSSRNNDQQEYHNQSKVIKTILKVNHEESNNVGTNIVKVNGGCNIKKDTSNTTTNLEKVITSSKKKDDNNHESGLDDSTYDAVDYIVKAEPAIVTEDQLDSLSVYDDATCAVSLGGDLYESIAGSIMNLAKKNSSMEDMYSSMLYQSSKKTNNKGEEFRSSMRSSSVYSETGVTSDEWIDLEETDTETYYDAQDKNPFVRASNVRNSHRASITTRKRCWQNRSSNRNISRRNWAQMASAAAAANSQHSRKGDVKDGDEELYESIYEVIQPLHHRQNNHHQNGSNNCSFESESDFDEIYADPSVISGSDQDQDQLKELNNYYSNNNTKLTKLAEAANKKMKKLRRNWSLKKSDISKSWSRIRKYSSPSMISQSAIRPAFPITISHSNTLKRKPSRRSNTNNNNTNGASAMSQQANLIDTKSVIRQHGGPVVGDGTNNDTTFYITLTIEQDDDDDDPLERIDSGDKTLKKKGWRSKRRVGGGSTSTSASSTGASSSSHAEPDSRSATISMSGSSVISGVTSKSSPDTSLTSGLGTSEGASCSNSTTPARPPKSRRPSMLTRPTVAPPDPPARKPITFMLGPGSSHRDYSEPSPASSNSVSSPSCESPEVLTQETYMSSFFQTEPLYQQFYTNQIHKLEESETSSIEDMYECVDHPDSMEISGQDPDNSDPAAASQDSDNSGTVTSGSGAVTSGLKFARPSAMDLTSACHGGRRSMWSELPEVMSSGILDNITSEAKKLHEAMFEVITSEASYLKSLNVLLKHFAQSPKLSAANPSQGSLDESSANTASVITKWDHKRLFGDVINVRQCSERFLEDLEKKWQSSILLDGLCEVVRDHAKNHFQVYVKYCSNQVDQGKLLKELSENPRFVESLKELESSPVCQSLKMQSFLMLPMQRITRLPLLIDAIFSRLDSNSSEFEVCREALEIINKVVHECNDSALIEGRRKEMLLLEQQLKFRENVKLFPLCSASRWLVKRGDVTRIYWKENAEAKLTFGRKVSKQTYNFLLFNDLLVVAKKKSDGTFLVIDYCPRNLVQMSKLLDESHEKLPYGMSHAKNIDLNQIVLFTMLQNHEHKTMEWLLIFPTESERTQWIELVTPPSTSPENPEEKIYEDWDCPLVEAVTSIEAENSNEVPLQKGDKANVLRKLSDSGWYYVERLADGQKGWVPMALTREIESNHIRARNFKQRHAFLKLLTSMDHTTTISSENDLLNNNNQTIINRYQVNLPVTTAIANGSSCTTTTTLSDDFKSID